MPDFLARFAAHGGSARAIGIVVLLVTAAAIAILRRRTNAVGLIARVLLLDVLIVVGLLTLLPASGGGQAVNLIPGRGVSALETAANVALFVPAGALLRLAFGRRLGALAAFGLAVPVVKSADRRPTGAFPRRIAPDPPEAPREEVARRRL